MSTVTHLKAHEKRVFDGCDGMQYEEVLDRAGCTYRQLVYWSQSGRVKAHYHVGGKITTKGGSGRIACWSPEQAKIVERVAALLRRGFELEHSFILATNLQAVAATLSELTAIQADLLEEQADPDEGDFE